MLYRVTAGENMYDLEIKHIEDEWSCRLNGYDIHIDTVALNENTLSLVMNGQSVEASRDVASGAGRIFINGIPYEVSLEDPRSLRSRKGRARSPHGSQTLLASMPGKVVRLLAREGETIQKGQGIVVLEAMKMQNEIRSPRDGVLAKLPAREGANVNSGEVLAVIE